MSYLPEHTITVFVSPLVAARRKDAPTPAGGPAMPEEIPVKVQSTVQDIIDAVCLAHGLVPHSPDVANIAMYETRWVRDDLGMYGINADGSIATVAAGLEGVGDRPVHLLKDEDGRPRLHAHPPPPKRRGAVAPYCRRLVRALHPDELPLVLIETWRSTAGRGGAPPTPALPSDLAMRGFLIRDRESDYSPFTNLRAEQCRILSTERLKRRLGELELAESGELTDVHNRYYDAMDLVRLRIAQLQMS